jgi:hypothetical protein
VNGKEYGHQQQKYRRHQGASGFCRRGLHWKNIKPPEKNSTIYGDSILIPYKQRYYTPQLALAYNIRD